MVRKEYSEDERKLMALASCLCIFSSSTAFIDIFWGNEFLGMLLSIVAIIVIGISMFFIIRFAKRIRAAKNFRS
jgi:uncharacterized membrane-anchored protein